MAAVIVIAAAAAAATFGGQSKSVAIQDSFHGDERERPLYCSYAGIFIP